MLLLILSQEDQSNLHHRRDRERPCISLRSQFELEIPWQWLANKNIVILCMCLLTQSMMMLNQKLTKSIVRRCSKRGIYIKKGGERLLEGRVFLGTYGIVTAVQLWNSLTIVAWRVRSWILVSRSAILFQAFSSCSFWVLYSSCCVPFVLGLFLLDRDGLGLVDEVAPEADMAYKEANQSSQRRVNVKLHPSKIVPM